MTSREHRAHFVTKLLALERAPVAQGRLDILVAHQSHHRPGVQASSEAVRTERPPESVQGPLGLVQAGTLRDPLAHSERVPVRQATLGRKDQRARALSAELAEPALKISRDYRDLPLLVRLGNEVRRMRPDMQVRTFPVVLVIFPGDPHRFHVPHAGVKQRLKIHEGVKVVPGCREEPFELVLVVHLWDPNGEPGPGRLELLQVHIEISEHSADPNVDVRLGPVGVGQAADVARQIHTFEVFERPIAVLVLQSAQNEIG